MTANPIVELNIFSLYWVDVTIKRKNRPARKYAQVTHASAERLCKVVGDTCTCTHVIIEPKHEVVMTSTFWVPK